MEIFTTFEPEDRLVRNIVHVFDWDDVENYNIEALNFTITNDTEFTL
ncbi:MAG: hypothetical protein FWE21_03720 [Defluviitaleaceae bacterium]|nr:hypothetical protein [Defluviitaleaceae bacterium]